VIKAHHPPASFRTRVVLVFYFCILLAYHCILYHVHTDLVQPSIQVVGETITIQLYILTVGNTINQELRMLGE